jgi:hypothetical protein
MINNYHGEFDKEGFNDETINGFTLLYTKNGRSPKNSWFKTRLEVTEFMINNLNSIDLLIINDVVIDKDKLINENLKLGRYLKLNKIYEI